MHFCSHLVVTLFCVLLLLSTVVLGAVLEHQGITFGLQKIAVFMVVKVYYPWFSSERFFILVGINDEDTH